MHDVLQIAGWVLSCLWILIWTYFVAAAGGALVMITTQNVHLTVLVAMVLLALMILFVTNLRYRA